LLSGEAVYTNFISINNGFEDYYTQTICSIPDSVNYIALSSSKHFGCYDILGKTFSSFIEPPKKTKYRNEIALTTDELHVILLVGRNNIVIYDRQTLKLIKTLESEYVYSQTCPYGNLY
jgi:hypothetical protein